MSFTENCNSRIKESSCSQWKLYFISKLIYIGRCIPADTWRQETTLLRRHLNVSTWLQHPYNVVLTLFACKDCGGRHDSLHVLLNCCSCSSCWWYYIKRKTTSNDVIQGGSQKFLFVTKGSIVFNTIFFWTTMWHRIILDMSKKTWQFHHEIRLYDDYWIFGVT